MRCMRVIARLVIIAALSFGCGDSFSITVSDSPEPLTSEGADQIFSVDVIAANTSIPLDLLQVMVFPTDDATTVGGDVYCEVHDANGDEHFGVHETAECREQATGNFAPRVVGTKFLVWGERERSPGRVGLDDGRRSIVDPGELYPPHGYGGCSQTSSGMHAPVQHPFATPGVVPFGQSGGALGS